jgi:carbon monoxide dehydrogenase subunit G
MRLEGRVAVQAPRERVWTFLLDPTALSSCIPGVESVRQLDERTFEGEISAAIGPLTGRFAFQTRIADAQPPSHLEGEMSGTDSVTGSRVTASVKADLGPAADDATTFAYVADVKVSGRLAIVGETVLRATAGVIFSRFAACLQDRLGEGRPERPVQREG